MCAGGRARVTRFMGGVNRDWAKGDEWRRARLDNTVTVELAANMAWGAHARWRVRASRLTTVDVPDLWEIMIRAPVTCISAEKCWSEGSEPPAHDRW